VKHLGLKEPDFLKKLNLEGFTGLNPDLLKRPNLIGSAISMVFEKYRTVPILPNTGEYRLVPGNAITVLHVVRGIEQAHSVSWPEDIRGA